jgi:signal transduction histidine kinase
VNEVSGQILGLYRRAALDLGTTAEALFAGTSVDPRHDVERFCWDAFCVASERLAARAAERGHRPTELLTHVGTQVFDVAAMKRAWSIVRWVASPRLVYWASHTWGGPSMFAHLVDLTFEDLPDGRLSLHIGIPASHRDSPEFFHLNRGVFQAMPRLLGSRDARVEMRLSARECVYVVEPPETETVWAAVRNRLRYVVSARDALAELSLQHRQLQERYRELGAARDAAERAKREAEAARDVAERAKGEAEIARDVAERALEARSNFLSVVGHEIRTPLHCILGTSELISTTTLDDEQREYVGMLRTGGETLLALIDDILDVEKLDAGKMTLDMEDIELARVVREVVDLASGKRPPSVSITCHVDPCLPVSIRGDVVRFRQVLLNLVSNAVKFTHVGTIAVHLTRRRSGARDELLVQVSDTGIGIPLAKQGSLFQPFAQADSTTTRKYGGSGLGLAISKQLVELFGGSIGVESEAGKGSRFWFTVPLHQEARLADEIDRSQAAPIGTTGSGAAAELTRLLLQV